ncbi:hypothetical protein C5167_043034 [Papaver somniferum]|uniref:Uncharacterized protein n=1 Tax=Papaver somniferum TaxID=3469 RepID=A0A4Y7L877_PAPSO|nr:hypothetical protein C5167_043034 [Papaver somniferum]
MKERLSIEKIYYTKLMELVEVLLRIMPQQQSTSEQPLQGGGVLYWKLIPFIAYRNVEIILSNGILRLLIEIKMGMRQKRSMQPLLILNSITFQQHESISRNDVNRQAKHFNVDGGTNKEIN